MRWLLSLLILNTYPLALSFESQRPEIREALFQCRLAMQEYFEIKEQADFSNFSPDEKLITESLRKSRNFLFKKMAKNKTAAEKNSFARNYSQQLLTCHKKTYSLSEADAFYRFIKREYRDIDCETKLTDSKLKSSEIKALCQGAKYFDLVFFKSNGHLPDLVLLGESHVMNKEAEVAGQNLLKAFKLRALEGYNGEFDTNDGSGLGYEFAMSLARIGIFGTSNIIRARNTGFYLWSDGEKSETYLDKKQIEISTFDNENPLMYVRDAINQIGQAPISVNLERNPKIRLEVEANCRSTKTCTGRKFKHYMIERRNDDMARTLLSLAGIAFPHKTILTIVGSDHIPGLSRRLSCRLDLSPKLISNALMGRAGAYESLAETRCDI